MLDFGDKGLLLRFLINQGLWKRHGQHEFKFHSRRNDVHGTRQYCRPLWQFLGSLEVFAFPLDDFEYDAR